MCGCVLQYCYYVYEDENECDYARDNELHHYYECAYEYVHVYAHENVVTVLYHELPILYL